MTLEGKVIAITGASSGIGRATGTLLAARGAAVVLGARREPILENLVAEIIADGGKAAHKATDVRRRADLEALVETAVQRFGRLDAIVNNAGIGPISRFDALRVDEWDAMIDVNLRGTLYGIAAALPVFARQDCGHVINVVSTAGLKILPTMGVYAATKNAVRTVTEALRQEAGPNLRVTEVSPGMVSTNFTQTITDPSVKEMIDGRMGDIGMAPEAIARAILYALEQPGDVDVGSIVVRPTAQG
ncbi:SDR family oxidoreductase [Pseudooceanicola sp. CBS1P-1]|uniref:SDR family NAD(P)-dependent oxidoreductase n=1 Tax=Pseudooceanicola albus TaxID=2692189 RepID=A0A6L7GCP5_9RHOB|nr:MULTISPECIES: SDR family oxidoreductase [Pseudooceanicola]MBT9386887.1 SDR family oxidoreductase [Pseudooceanicola endophyticus]MXN21056.1 SDR family NAD(P)-dependent oxidoreductase [Pseudooceanicola albus]